MPITRSVDAAIETMKFSKKWCDIKSSAYTVHRHITPSIFTDSLALPMVA